MSILISPTTRTEAQQPSPAAELMDVISFTPAITERLVLDEAGRSFEPLQLTPNKDIVQQAGLLMRHEPVGGAESQISENARQLRALALDQLNRVLTSAGSTRSLLQSLRSEARARNDQCAQHYRRVNQRFTTIQEQLHRWQAQNGRRSGDAGGGLLHWLFGGEERLSLPEAISVWNERERLARDRAAWRAALDLHAWFLITVTDLFNQLDDLLAAARQLRARVEHERGRLRLSSSVFAPWTLRIEPQAVCDALVATIDAEGVAAELLRRQTQAGDVSAMAPHVRELARQEAEQRLASLTIADLIDLDARSGGASDPDPLLLAGQSLLETLQRPSWQISHRARPRVETMQVTPDGAPVYSMEGLSTAAYGDGHDRLGFVQVYLGVAKDDLTLLREGAEAFQAMLQQRNLYVLDDLAQSWSCRQPAAQTPSAAPPEINGQEGANGKADIEIVM